MVAKLAVVACVIALAAGPAGAETQAWSALKTGIPGGAKVVVSIDVAALRGSPAFDKAVAEVVDQHWDLVQAFQLAASVCKLDVTKIVDAVAIEVDDHGHGAVVIGLAPNIDEAKIHRCLTGIASARSGREATAPVVSQQTGGVTKYWVKHHPEDAGPLYLAWLRNDVVAIGFTPGDPAELEALIAAKGVKPDLAARLAKADAGATAFGAAVIGEDHIAGGFGNLRLAKATLAAEVHVALDDPAAAAKARTDAASELARTIKQHSAKYPGVTRVLSGVVLGGTGPELTLTATLSIADVPDFLAGFDHVF